MFSKFFIERPIFATVLAMIIVVAGIVTLGILPIAQYPDITPPTVQVSASYPGANAQTVAQTVGIPIEQQVNGVDGMLYMSSTSSSSGAYSLTVRIWLSLRHRKTPHFLVQVLYHTCLTNGVQFTDLRSFFVYRISISRL